MLPPSAVSGGYIFCYITFLGDLNFFIFPKEFFQNLVTININFSTLCKKR